MKFTSTVRALAAIAILPIATKAPAADATSSVETTSSFGSGAVISTTGGSIPEGFTPVKLAQIKSSQSTEEPVKIRLARIRLDVLLKQYAKVQESLMETQTALQTAEPDDAPAQKLGAAKEERLQRYTQMLEDQIRGLDERIKAMSEEAAAKSNGPSPGMPAGQ